MTVPQHPNAPPALPRRPMALKAIGRATLKVARPVLAKYGVSEAALVDAWHEIAGPRWAGLARPEHLNRQSQTLTIRVAGASAIELQHQEPQLVERINTFAGRPIVRRLKIIQAPLWRPAQTARPPRPLTGREEARLADGVAAIESAELRSAALRLGRALLARS